MQHNLYYSSRHKNIHKETIWFDSRTMQSTTKFSSRSKDERVEARNSDSLSSYQLITFVLIVLVCVGALIWLDQRAESKKPNIALADIEVIDADSSCGASQNEKEVGADFTLVNDGMTDGIAEVHMTGGGRTLGIQYYLVKGGASVHESIKTMVQCYESFVVSVWIAQVITA